MTIYVRTLLSALALSFAAGGCSTWEGLSTREKSTAVGAGLGGAVGAAATDGSVLGTVGGAAIGGVVGDQVGKRSND